MFNAELSYYKLVIIQEPIEEDLDCAKLKTMKNLTAPGIHGKYYRIRLKNISNYSYEVLIDSQ